VYYVVPHSPGHGKKSTLRFGALGAARITPPALLASAREHDGVEVTCVAARDPDRAQAFASKNV